MPDTPIRVDCTECHFTRIVHAEDGDLPSDIVVEHGRGTGHKLTVAKLEEDREDVSP